MLYFAWLSNKHQEETLKGTKKLGQKHNACPRSKESFLQTFHLIAHLRITSQEHKSSAKDHSGASCGATQFPKLQPW